MASNLLDGRHSKDLEVDNLLVPFINRNASTYPTEIGSAAFAPVPIKEQKDIMLNVARANAEQEFQRIMDLVEVLKKQANDLEQRLLLTEKIHQAKFNFKPVVNSIYWVVQVDTDQILTPLGPNDWSTGAPNNYKYMYKVKFLGDYTWINIES